MFEIEEREYEVMLTVENRLGLYSTERKDERNAILWYVWQQNKRWLSNILDWILPSFPNYSMHDKSHAFSVLHNIEMLLGEQQIMKLSASDCFMILHVVFLHDIGMCITTSDREKLMSNPKFICFLQESEEKGDEQTRKYAKSLLKYCKEAGVEESLKKVLKAKLDVYYAMIFLVADYVRKEHASNSRRMLDKWLEQSDKAGLGYGFSYSGIPRRLFYTVGACACVHNSSDFNDVMALPKIDDGFAHDYIHPRFIAVLLQLGDSLDLDNDRFHPLIREVMGELPWKSGIHYEKHDAIRRLRISPSKITIAADCHSPEVLRLISKECDSIKNILKNASYHWSAICPDDLDAPLPNFEPVELRMNGQIISDKLVNAEFKIQQKKAFNFLQGGNFYKDVKFAFLRELFQNAVDASKMQYWVDWIGGRWNLQNNKNSIKTTNNLSDMGMRLSPSSYPIVVELHLAQRKKDSGEITRLDKNSDYQREVEKKKDVEYGVLVCMIDYGIGMSAEDISAIADVGTSYERNEDRRKGMPSWLLPTAEFGIGLQSVFLVANSFVAYTHTRSGEKYKIVFQATGDKGSGYIHVMPSEEGEVIQYGTRMEVFVPGTEKKRHQQELKSWCGKDPFSEDYDIDRPFRHARELAVQLAASLDSMIGERIFPIELQIYDFVEPEDEIYSILLSREIKKLNYKVLLNGKDAIKLKNSSTSFEAKKEYVAWPFYNNTTSDNIVRGKFGQIEYMFEFEHIKLYLYDHDHHDVYARFGADRLQHIWEYAKKYVQEEEEDGIKVYYKGIYVETKSWEKDANLLEYIDIKEKIERKYLKINRCEFTSEGQTYLEEQIYPHILDIAKQILLHCDCNNVIEKIKARLNKLLDIEECQLYNAILAALGLATFAQIRNKKSYISEEEQKNANKWNDLIEHISKMINDNKEDTKVWTDSSMFNITVLNIKDEKNKIFELNNSTENIATIFNSNNKYAIMSVRKSKGRLWREFIIKLNNESISNSEETEILKYIKEEYIKLDKEEYWETRKELLEKIEQEGDALLSACRKFAITEQEKNLKTGNGVRIIKWILCNIPSTEMFFSEDYNLRINVLGLEYSDTIYLNRYIRKAILEKMERVNRERNIERFATIVPCGYSGLEIHDKEKSVFYVKRGFFLYMDRPYVINPFTARAMKIVIDGLNSLNKFSSDLTSLICDGKKENIDCAILQIIEYYKDDRDLFGKIIISQEYKLIWEENKISETKEKELDMLISEKMSFLLCDSINVDTNEMLKKYICFVLNKEEIAVKLIDEIYKNNHIEDIEQINENAKETERLLNYVLKKNNWNMTKKECFDLYKTYFYEWIYMIILAIHI